MPRTLHCLVSGRVQGVWFRGFTQDTARSLGLAGWVRNLPDGRVEAKAQGDDDSLAAFREKLRQGPPYSSVHSVDCNEIDDEPFSGFSIVR
ncbi:acylphosphatase [Oceanidesulfovibrio indonesiensis]|uniref:Acylphosphatase n=1 Tax=Oceanidesulfovibrio indonesiensis TaxID=54767 RepID=A0A7M3MBX8_9BACT|nr:acylphosphatase [Oceanidesulfovibrio indonesiensis]TVM15367.1 acylphosphatase [Oceanidesulfovibrio indonesiensis]